MRLDIDCYDDYPPDKQDLCRRVKILLDGNEIKHVTVADEEQGYIIRHKTDLLGHLVVSDGEIELEKIYGLVRIIDPDQPAVGQQA